MEWDSFTGQEIYLVKYAALTPAWENWLGVHFWMLESVFPNTSLRALDMAPFDHTPCILSIATDIPKSRIFRFENFWLLDNQFSNILAKCWSETTHHTDCAKALTAKFKTLRKRLREWQASKTGLRTITANTRITLQFLEVLWDYRDLSIEEWNFKDLLKDHLVTLLEKQRLY